MQNLTIQFTTKDGDPATMEVTYTGNKSMGIDGIDHYFDIDFGRENIDEVEIDNWFLNRFYGYKCAPGGSFCHDYTIQRSQYDASSCIVIVHWRYDV